jgi:hypothetical protein
VKRTLGVLLIALAMFLGVGAATSAGAGTGTHDRAGGRPVLHRVVWDQDIPDRSGVHLRVADPDGSHAHQIYASHRGFTTALSVDRRGRRVAFAPCCRSRLPRLVVVPLSGGRARQPLRHHPGFFFVGGIGWSPHGSRLVFEGEKSRPHGQIAAALWTVLPDGSGLHRVLRLPDPTTDESVPNVALAWTRLGILYCEGDALRLAHHGRSRLLLRGAFSVRISGDGRHIVTERYNRSTYRASIWYGDADGTRQHRLWLGPGATTSHAPRYGYPVPDFHGRRLLVDGVPDPDDPSSEGIGSWGVDRDPDSARVLPFLSNAFAFAWN